MQKIFRIWIAFIFVFAIIAAFIVDISSILFGFVILPVIIIAGFFVILGFINK
jgi:hypothetical protein